MVWLFPYFIPNVKINKEPDIKAYYRSARKNWYFPWVNNIEMSDFITENIWLHKSCKLPHDKRTVNKVFWKMTGWEKYISSKRNPKINMETIWRAFSIIRKSFQKGKKLTKKINGQFTGKEIQVASSCMKICLSSFLMREMQNKILSLHISFTVWRVSKTLIISSIETMWGHQVGVGSFEEASGRVTWLSLQ